MNTAHFSIIVLGKQSAGIINQKLSTNNIDISCLEANFSTKDT